MMYENTVGDYFPNGYLNSEHKVFFADDGNYDNWVSIPEDMGFIPRFENPLKSYRHSRRSQADREQDHFLFSFGDVQGKFIIGKNGSILPIEDTRLKFVKYDANMLNQGIRTTISQFDITATDGMIYKFRDFEKTEITRNNATSDNGVVNSLTNIALSVSGAPPLQKYVITKWFLSEIVNPFTNEKIVFEYETFTIDDIISKIPIHQASSGTSSVTLVQNKLKVITKKLKKITLPDGHELVFTYNTNSRQDLQGDKALQKISVRYNGADKYAYLFTHGYFFKNEIKDESFTPSASEKRFMRMCLKSVQKEGVNAEKEPPLSFSYYSGDNASDDQDCVPPRYSLAQDYYGYYNKSPNASINVETPSDLYMKYLCTGNGHDLSPGLAKKWSFENRYAAYGRYPYL